MCIKTGGLVIRKRSRDPGLAKKTVGRKGLDFALFDYVPESHRNQF